MQSDLLVAEVDLVLVYNELRQLYGARLARLLLTRLLEASLGLLTGSIRLLKGGVVVARAHRHGHSVLTAVLLDAPFEVLSLASSAVRDKDVVDLLEVHVDVVMVSVHAPVLLMLLLLRVLDLLRNLLVVVGRHLMPVYVASVTLVPAAIRADSVVVLRLV